MARYDVILIFVLGLVAGILLARTLMSKASASVMENVEWWEAVRDEKGRLVKIIVHRKQERADNG